MSKAQVQPLIVSGKIRPYRFWIDGQWVINRVGRYGFKLTRVIASSKVDEANKQEVLFGSLLEAGDPKLLGFDLRPSAKERGRRCFSMTAIDDKFIGQRLETYSVIEADEDAPDGFISHARERERFYEDKNSGTMLPDIAIEIDRNGLIARMSEWIMDAKQAYANGVTESHVEAIKPIVLVDEALALEALSFVPKPKAKAETTS